MDPRAIGSERSSSNGPLAPGVSTLGRRTFFKLGAALVLGASALFGKLVGFAPSAFAAVINCILITQLPDARLLASAPATALPVAVTPIPQS
jgi:hypothetical protein